jgi:hypothetical protein
VVEVVVVVVVVVEAVVVKVDVAVIIALFVGDNNVADEPEVDSIGEVET